MGEENLATTAGRAAQPVLPAEVVAASPVVLRDGAEISIVAMAATDSERLMRFHRTLSDKTTYSRFFFFHPDLSDKEVHRFTHVDHRDREALVALADDEIVAVARFDRLDDPTEAEVAFVVADSWQSRGIGSHLFDRLAKLATNAGVARFVADTLPNNKRMLAVFHGADHPVTERIAAGVVHLTIELEPASSAPVANEPEAASPTRRKPI